MKDMPERIIDEQEDLILRLLAEIEELGKDKKRLDWLVDNRCACTKQLAGRFYVGYITEDLFVFKVTETYETRNEAIDAAMEIK